MPVSAAATGVCVALHTGEAERRADGTYQGAVVHRGERLRSVGHGGQILVSQATYELLGERRPEGARLRDLGVHRLDDLVGPERVWQLWAPGLRDDLPPPRSLDTVANNLAVPLTSFVGREDQIASLDALVRSHRLVTLTGAGGCGKTRLALQAAASVAASYPDGIWWVDLAPLGDPAFVPAALAGPLGVRESPLEPITDTVVHYLAARRALIVLDNCEHVAAACAEFAARLVQACPAVTVLATSRERLGVAGEIASSVPPLSLPHDTTVATSESVCLFVDRARAARPTFTLTDDNTPAVVEICVRLDGIPLAIELAAARTRMLSPAEIAAGLGDRFRLLTGGARTALPHQRTLQGSVDWSHDLLDDRERAVFRRLAVFAGSFTLDAAEAVCTGGEIARTQVLDLLSGLVDRSLVQVVDEAGSETRYRLLETIRDYAGHRLSEAGEAEAARDRHLDQFVSFAERVAAGLEGPDLIVWLARVDADLDNLRTALDWSVHCGDPVRGLRLVGHLQMYWFARSELAMGRARLEATLENATGEGRERADALNALCIVAYRAGDMVKARRYGDEAIAMARDLADGRTLGRALHWRAWRRYWGEEGDRLAAWAAFEEADALLRQSNDHVFTALNLAVAGFSYVTSTEPSRARPLLTEGLSVTAANGAPHARCYCLVYLGYLDVMEGSFEDAAMHLDEGLVLAETIGDHYVACLARMSLALLADFRGRYQDGHTHCEAGLVAALAHRNPPGEAFLRMVLGRLAFAEGHVDAAAAELEAAFALLTNRMLRLAARCRAVQAHVALARSRPAQARHYAAEAFKPCWRDSTAIPAEPRIGFTMRSPSHGRPVIARWCVRSSMCSVAWSRTKAASRKRLGCSVARRGYGAGSATRAFRCTNPPMRPT